MRLRSEVSTNVDSYHAKTTHGIFVTPQSFLLYVVWVLWRGILLLTSGRCVGDDEVSLQGARRVMRLRLRLHYDHCFATIWNHLATHSCGDCTGFTPRYHMVMALENWVSKEWYSKALPIGGKCTASINVHSFCLGTTRLCMESVQNLQNPRIPRKTFVDIARLSLAYMFPEQNCVLGCFSGTCCLGGCSLPLHVALVAI
eukprot:2706117-Amphidinium_carterae.1